MNEEKKYLDYAGLAIYDRKIKALISAASGNVEALQNFIGELPEGADEETIVAWVQNQIKDVTDAIGEVSELTGDVTSSLVEALNAEMARAKGAEEALGQRIDALEEAVGAPADEEKGASGLYAALEEAKAAAEEAKAAVEDIDVSGDINSAIEALDLPNTYAGKGIESTVGTLVGDDADKSVREIAAEELAAQLIPESAKESLDTLEEIAAWIQAHPEDASAMNADIEALKTAVGTPKVEATETEAEKASTGLYKKIDDLDNSTDSRLDALELALGMKDPEEGDDAKSVAEKVADLENSVGDLDTRVEALENADKFVAITEEEIMKLFNEEANA